MGVPVAKAAVVPVIFDSHNIATVVVSLVTAFVPSDVVPVYPLSTVLRGVATLPTVVVLVSGTAGVLLTEYL